MILESVTVHAVVCAAHKQERPRLTLSGIAAEPREGDKYGLVVIDLRHTPQDTKIQRDITVEDLTTPARR